MSVGIKGINSSNLMDLYTGDRKESEKVESQSSTHTRGTQRYIEYARARGFLQKPNSRLIRGLPATITGLIAAHSSLTDAKALLEVQRALKLSNTAEMSAAKNSAALLAKAYWPQALQGKEDAVARKLVQECITGNILPFRFPDGFEKVKNRVRHLDLTVSGSITTGLLTELHRHFPKLQGLRLRTIITDDTLQQIATQWRDLQELDITRSQSVTAALISNAGIESLTQLSELRSLCLLNVHITDEGLKSLASCTKLESIKFDTCDVITLAIIQRLKSFLHLRHLHLESRDITDEGCAELKKLSQLQTLCLGDCRNMTITGFKDITSLSHLQSLRLKHTEVTDAWCAELKNLSELRTVDLSVSDVTIAGFRDIASIRSLQNIRLNNTWGVTDEWFACLAGHTLLQTLELQGCHEITDSGFAHLANKSELRHLSVEFSQITDAGLASLRNLVKLQYLNLFCARNITNAGLLHLRRMTELQTLCLRDCYGLTDAGLVHLIPLKGLQELDLGGPGRSQFTNTGVSSIITLSKLQKLKLDFVNLTDEGLLRLQDLRQLHCLSIAGCSKLTLSGKTALSNALGLLLIPGDTLLSRQ